MIDGNHLSSQGLKGTLEAEQVVWFGKNCEIDVAAKFRSSVEHAGLASHEEAPDAMRSHRRKDFECRVLAQAYLRVINKWSTGGRILPSALRE
jgi:hypothetical protein